MSILRVIIIDGGVLNEVRMNILRVMIDGAALGYLKLFCI